MENVIFTQQQMQELMARLGEVPMKFALPIAQFLESVVRSQPTPQPETQPESA